MATTEVKRSVDALQKSILEHTDPSEGNVGQRIYHAISDCGQRLASHSDDESARRIKQLEGELHATKRLLGNLVAFLINKEVLDETELDLMLVGAVTDGDAVGETFGTTDTARKFPSEE